MDIIKGIRSRRGAKLNIKGVAEKTLSKTSSSPTYALNPDDFFGTTPKLLVKEGASLKAGDPIFLVNRIQELKLFPQFQEQ